MNIYSRSLLPSVESRNFGAITDRTLASLRLFLSISALVIIWIDPSDASRSGQITSYAVAAYIFYSLGIYLLVRRTTNFSWRTMQYVTWVDVLWYSALMTLGTETNAVFFFFYLFAIISGASRGGTRIGLQLTVVCTAIFITLNLLLISELQLDVSRFARRAVYMAMLGYILAYWGGAEAILRKRLTFLKELSLLSNPRFGADRTIRQMLRRFLEYYHADYCCVLLREPDLDLALYIVDKGDPLVDTEPMKVRERPDNPLMNSYDPRMAAYVERASFFQRRPRYRVCDAEGHVPVDVEPGVAQDAAEMLNVRSFIAAPLRYRNRIRGRVLIGSSQPTHFDMADVIFLQQAADQALPVIENFRLVDRLAKDAAEEERRKIARTVHDRVIQPYLGLQIGLKALQRELFRPGRRIDVPTARRGESLLEQLVAMTREGIDELRQCVSGLKHSDAEETTLADSLRRFAERFKSATGIHVEVVDGACGLTMNDRLSAEIFQMATEALSNIHRHTQARSAEIRLNILDNCLELSVENHASGEAPAAFKPLSIFERAEALGARLEILNPEGKTLVKVEVPL
jgi:signal transduction histidine kinase